MALVAPSGDLLVKRVWIARLKDLVAPGHCEQLFVADVFDLMRVQRGIEMNSGFSPETRNSRTRPSPTRRMRMTASPRTTQNHSTLRL